MALETQEVQLPGIGLFIDNQRGLLIFQIISPADQAGECVAGWIEAGKGVENVQLFGGMKEGLVFVRPVHIDQFAAHGGQHLQRGGGAVDELPVGAGGGQDALEQELIVGAGFEAVFLEGFLQAAQRRAFENGFHRTILAAGADQIAVRAFAQNQMKRADDNGFAGAGFAGDGIVSRLQ